jgi:hypothetical protein
MKPDRRRTPRTNLAGLAYISFDPGNGGIVLNISEDGLCFHSVASVRLGSALPFSLSANGERIEAVGLLTWTDEHRKTGGLRFNDLAPDTRRQIRTLIEQSSRPLSGEKDLAVPVSGSQRSSERLPNRAPAATPVVADPISPRVRAPLRWGDFSRGMAAGVLIAILVATGFSLDARRRQIGSFLIRLGERLEVTPQRAPAPEVASTQAPSAPSSAAPPIARHGVALRATVPATPASTSPTLVQRAENPLPPAAEKDQPEVRSKLAPIDAAPGVATSPTNPSSLSSATFASAAPLLAAANASQPASATSQPAASVPQPVSPLSPSPAGNASVVAKAADQPGENEYADDIVEINSGIPPGKYFDVGKFKDQIAANQIERNLSDVGFRTTVLPKSLLWMKSYQVLVGPYGNEHDAEVARHGLQTQGYKPHALPERSRQLTLTGSREAQAGRFAEERDTDNLVVTWEAYSAQATVRFNKGEVSAKAIGKWVKLPNPSPYSAIVYTTGDPGRRTLLSIRFQGMKQAVMLPSSADRGIVF